MAGSVLIVGGAGATGLSLVSQLAEQGYRISILHRGVHEPDHLKGFRHIHADPHFAESVQGELKGETFDVVILTYGRIASLAGVFANRCGRLLSVGGIPLYDGFVEPGTASPTGMAIQAREDQDPVDPGRVRSEAASRFVQKMREAEQAVLDQHARGAYAASIFRFPRLYGPHGIVSQEWSILQRVRDGRSFLLLPNCGLAIISRCAAVNAARTLLLAIDCPAAFGQVFNCGDADQFSLSQWCEIVLAALGAELELVGLPPGLNWCAPQFALYGGTMFGHALTDTSKAQRILGYRDVIPAKQAIQESVRWWQTQGTEIGGPQIVRDNFDYGTEDRIRSLLGRIATEAPEARAASWPVHSYPHPKTPSLEKDHHGR